MGRFGLNFSPDGLFNCFPWIVLFIYAGSWSAINKLITRLSPDVRILDPLVTLVVDSNSLALGSLPHLTYRNLMWSSDDPSCLFSGPYRLWGTHFPLQSYVVLVKWLIPQFSLRLLSNQNYHYNLPISRRILGGVKTVCHLRRNLKGTSFASIECKNLEIRETERNIPL